MIAEIHQLIFLSHRMPPGLNSASNIEHGTSTPTPTPTPVHPTNPTHASAFHLLLLTHQLACIVICSVSSRTLLCTRSAGDSGWVQVGQTYTDSNGWLRHLESRPSPRPTRTTSDSSSKWRKRSESSKANVSCGTSTPHPRRRLTTIPFDALAIHTCTCTHRTVIPTG